MTGWTAPSKGGYQATDTGTPPELRVPPSNPASSTDPRALRPGEIVFSENVQADRYKALLDRLNRPSQAMTPTELERIAGAAWDRLPGDTPWSEVNPESRAAHVADFRVYCQTLADLMPIETLHGADGASVWLRGEQ